MRALRLFAVLFVALSAAFYPLLLAEPTYATDGTIFASVDEGGTLYVTAPNGAVFTAVLFASYGTPVDTTLSDCNADTSVAVISNAFLGQNASSVGAINEVFGDPCGGIYKHLNVLLQYSVPVTSVEIVPVPVVTPPATVDPSPTPLPSVTPIPLDTLLPTPTPTEITQTPLPAPSTTPSDTLTVIAPVPTPSPSPTVVVDPLPIPTPTLQPVPAPEPTPTPQPVVPPAPVPAPQPTPIEIPKPPKPEPSPTPSPEPSVDPTPSPLPEPSVPPAPAPEPSPQPSVDPTPAPAPVPAPQPTPDPIPAPEPSVAPTPEPAPSPEPTLVPVPAPTPEPTPEPPAPEPSPQPPVIVPGLIANNPNQLSDTTPKVAPPEVLVPHIQVDKPGVENGGIQFFGTKSAPQVVGEDGRLTPPAPPPGSGLPIPPDAITTTATFIGQPGGTTFNSPDIAVPIIETPVTGTLASVPGIQTINHAFVAMANIGNDMSPVTRKKAKKILVVTAVLGQIAQLRRRN